MSRSMWIWRVIAPGLGLACCLAVFYQTSRATSPSGRPSAAKSPENDRVIAEGRLASRPGAEVTLGSESGGTVVAVPALGLGSVKRGDLLIEFASVDQRAALAEAEAKLTEAEAELAFHGREYARQSKSARAELMVAEIDATRRDYEIAGARRKAAQAAIDRCRSALDRTKVTSPIDGVVVSRNVQVGEVVPPFAKLVTVCDLSRVWIEAEVDEFDAPAVAVGDEASIAAEGQDGRSWKGTVEEVPDRVTDRNLRPDDPGRPSDTHVLVVKVGFDGPLPLKLGQKVQVEVRPRASAGSPGGPASRRP